VPRFVTDRPHPTPSAESIDAVAAAVNKADKVALLVGRGPVAPARRCLLSPTG
jgi:thiamine pyrophosphate-dependent acetolactate synthase large subunit-like protein